MRFLLLVLAIFVNSIYATDIIKFDTKEKHNRYYTLVSEIRCPVCQGQSISDSNASLAKDLRQVVVKMLTENKSDAEIKKFMVDRYGNFASFTPPINNSTLLLWFAPFTLIIIILSSVIYKIKTSKKPKQDIDISNTDKYL